jgi:pimeloyl-ACP methyl ester carboxylesterase
MPALFDDFGRFLNLGPRSQAAVADQVHRIAGRPLKEFVGSVLADVPVPTLVIHAPDDREVSPDHAEHYARAGEHVRLHWAPGLGHRRILADPGIVSEALGFVARQPATVH